MAVYIDGVDRKTVATEPVVAWLEHDDGHPPLSFLAMVGGEGGTIFMAHRAHDSDASGLEFVAVTRADEQSIRRAVEVHKAAKLEYEPPYEPQG